MDYAAELTKVLGSNQTLALVVLIGVNLVLGVLAAAKDGKFELVELFAILKKVAIFGGTYLGLGVASPAMPDPAAVVAEAGTWGALVAFAASSLKNARELGVPGIPDFVARRPIEEVLKVLPTDTIKAGDVLFHVSGEVARVVEVTPNGHLVVDMRAARFGPFERSLFPRWLNPPQR